MREQHHNVDLGAAAKRFDGGAAGVTDEIVDAIFGGGAG